jgi:hypothetical protein
MVVRARTRPMPPTRSGPWRLSDTAESELLALCPGCKALEVIRFSGPMMITTRKFAQRADGGQPRLEMHPRRSRPARRSLPAKKQVSEVGNGVVDVDTGRGPRRPRHPAD